MLCTSVGFATHWSNCCTLRCSSARFPPSAAATEIRCRLLFPRSGVTWTGAVCDAPAAVPKRLSHAQRLERQTVHAEPVVAALLPQLNKNVRRPLIPTRQRSRRLLKRTTAAGRSVRARHRRALSDATLELPAAAIGTSSFRAVLKLLRGKVGAVQRARWPRLLHVKGGSAACWPIGPLQVWNALLGLAAVAAARTKE